MGKVVEIDCEKSMKLETSPKVTKSKQSLHWCRSISKKIPAHFFITVSVKKLLHYRAGGLLQYRAFYYIIGQLFHYRAFFITLSGTYYSIGRLLHYRLVQGLCQFGDHSSCYKLSLSYSNMPIALVAIAPLYEI